MSDFKTNKPTTVDQYSKRGHDTAEEKDVSKKRVKKYSSSDSEDSDDSTSSSSLSSASSLSSSSSSSSAKRKKKSKQKKRKMKKKEKKLKRKLKSKKKKLKKKLKVKDKKEKTKVKTKEEEESMVGPIPLPGSQEVPDRSKRMAPMTKEEWEKKQSVVRRVYDEATGRHRLIKGDGEVLEEIVSKQRHQEINRQATQGDGTSFQNELAYKLGQRGSNNKPFS